eukprot:TRINITY_DN1786_c1_g1_i4.p1 TRINITY_DN1786_c1_g1~~TRINITY_DN1786_c1_g1_i4.p1  ORF type:complete len:496 (-),score=159.76 TRINITY_DN1786_c1_g1_i4:292-1599(-)
MAKKLEAKEELVTDLLNKLKSSGFQFQDSQREVGQLQRALNAEKRRLEEQTVEEKVKLGKLESEIATKEEKISSLEERVRKQAQDLEILSRRLVEEEQQKEANVKRKEISIATYKERLADAEEALAYAQLTVKKAEDAAFAFARELSQLKAQWLPSWMSSRVQALQAQAIARWKEYVMPFIILAKAQAIESLTSAMEWAHPHATKVFKESKHFLVTTVVASTPPILRASKSIQKLRPVVVENFSSAWKSVEPLVNQTQSYILENSQPLRLSIKSALANATEKTRPHIAGAMNAVEPYVELITVKAALWLNNTQMFLVPVTRRLSLLTSALVAQLAAVHTDLQKEVQLVAGSKAAGEAATESDTSADLLWWQASIVMLLPLFTLLACALISVGLKKLLGLEGKRKLPGSSSGLNGVIGGKHKGGSHNAHRIRRKKH